MSRIVAGIATLHERRHFFRARALPSIVHQVDEVFVYRDLQSPPPGIHYVQKVNDIYQQGKPSLGDAGKFCGYELTGSNDFYYFTFDDDLVYPTDYCQLMIAWIEHYSRSAVVSLHGSSFDSFPIASYYRDRKTHFCLKDVFGPKRVLFPGTGCLAFHSSTLSPYVSEFKTRNMADIWFGLLLQKEKIPAVVLPHRGDYLTYNENLPLEETIWGQENQNDFIQTALINQFSLDPGFHLLPLLEEGDRLPPPPLAPVDEPLPQE